MFPFKSRFFLVLFCLVVSVVPQSARAQAIGITQNGPHNAFEIRAVGAKGWYLGFDVFADGRLLAPVRFTSLGLITAPNAAVRTEGATSCLLFDGLTAQPNCGLTLAESRIEVILTAQQYPVVRFDLHIAAFDAKRWQAVTGRNPFHFLTLGLPDASLWLGGGFLEPIAKQKTGWSAFPPLSGSPLPVVGLWSPEKQTFAAWDFLPSRLTDNSERDLAAGYCANLTAEPAYRELPPPPPAGKRTPLTKTPIPPPSTPIAPFQPKTPRPHLSGESAGHFAAIVFPAGGQGYQKIVFPRGGEHLASSVTLVCDTSLSGTDSPNRLLWQNWWSNSTLRELLPRVPAAADVTWIPGDLHLQKLADTVEKSSGLVLNALTAEDIRKQVRNAARTLRQTEETPEENAAHITALLDYYDAFRSSYEAHESALQALELAHNRAYSGLTIGAGNGSHGDGFDSAFLPSAGRDSGAAGSGTSDRMRNALARTAVTTGDPILLWAVQGMMSRWPLLFKNVARAALADYRGADLSAGLALAPGSPLGVPGTRAEADGGHPFALLDPVDGTNARIVVGERAALLFVRGKVPIRLADYRCAAPGNFAFTVRTTAPEISVTVTFPNADMGRVPVTIVRNRIVRIPLRDGRQLHRDSAAPSSLLVTGLRNRDTLLIGDAAALSAEVLPAAPPHTYNEKPEFAGKVAGFDLVPLFLNTLVRRDWTRHDTFALLPVGVTWQNGVPFSISARGALKNADAPYVLPRPLTDTRRVYALYEPADNAAEERLPLLLLDDGGIAPPVEPATKAAWQAWPPLFTAHLCVAAYQIPAGRQIVAIDTAGLRLFALTVESANEK